MAERSGVIVRPTAYVLAAALAPARIWQDARQPPTASVNLSARNPLDDHLPDQVASLLVALGVRLSIDDHGAGCTSLGQLKSLPVAELKVDRASIMTMVEDTRDALIVRSVVDLGHNLGSTIATEEVENLDRWRAARGQIPAQSSSARSGRRST